MKNFRKFLHKYLTLCCKSHKNEDISIKKLQEFLRPPVYASQLVAR